MSSDTPWLDLILTMVSCSLMRVTVSAMVLMSPREPGILHKMPTATLGSRPLAMIPT